MNGHAGVPKTLGGLYLFVRMHPYKTSLLILCIFTAALSTLSAESLDSAGAGSDLFGKTIRSIEFSADLPMDRSHYAPFIGLKPGDMLTRTGVKRAIQFLHECGRFSSIGVDAAPNGNSVDILFHLKHNYYFNKFSISGNVDLRGRSLWESVALPIGQRFTEGRLEESRAAVLKFLSERGFYLAQVKARTMADEQNRQVDTFFEVQPGELSTIRSVNIAGVPASDEEALLRRFGYRQGQRYDRSRLSTRLDNLKKQFRKGGFLAAVAQVTEVFDAENNAVDLAVSVSNFGKMKVEVDGYKIDKDQLRRLLPILTGEGIDRVVLDEGLKNLKEYLEKQGYSEADVQISETVDTSGVRIFHYMIVPNHKFTVSYIRFKGNQAISDRELLASLQIQPRAFSPSTIYSAALLDDDVDALKSLYESRGRLNARVIPVLEPIDNGKKVGITYLCEEGPLATVNTLNLSGNAALPTRELMPRIKLAPGTPYSPALAEQDRQAMLAVYNDRGFLWAQVAVHVGSPNQANSYPVEFQIREGTQSVVERIQILGNERTRASVIRKRIGLKENEPLSLGKMLQTQQALYGLGVFDQVRVAQQNADAAAPFQDVVVRLQESKRFTVRYGLGYQEREKLRGTIEFTHVNLLGLARRAQIRLRGSSIEQQALLSLQQPQFRDVPVDSYLTFSAGRKKEVSFDSRRFNASYQYSYPFAVHRWGMLRYNFRNVRIMNPQVPESTLGREDSPRNFSTFSAAFVNDTRDEFLDPTKGFFSSTDFGYTPKVLSSQSFVSFFTQNSYYRPLPKAFQFAASVRFGAGHSLEKGPDLPISERFFAGGGSSLRGFDTDYAGPLDPGTGKPIGGNALFVGSTEIRFPIFRFVHFAGFYDTGNVFRTIGDIRLSGFSHTLGGGLRIKTPFGPLRADYGYNLNMSADLRRQGQNRGHLFITVGPPF
jgi:outer membrane protein insertion porin family